LPAAAQLLRAGKRAYAAFRRFFAKSYARLAVFTVVALVAKWGALGRAGLFPSISDSEHFSLYEEAARLTVRKFHELPFWNPYYCGGIPALGTPSARFASPTFFLTLLFGTLRANPLILMAMTVVGLEGTYRYARAYGGGVIGAMVASPIFAISGAFTLWGLSDWTNFYAFQLIPWTLCAARRTFRGSRRGVVVLAASVAWMIGFGGTYAAPLTAVAVAWEGLLAIAERRNRSRDVARTFVFAAAALVFAVAMSLFRIWPIAENLAGSPRVLGGGDSTSLKDLYDDLFAHDGWTAFHGLYAVGSLILPILFLGGLRRRAIPLLTSGLLWLWLALGYGVKPSLFGLLRTIPPYTMLRAPDRFLTLFTLGLAVVASLAIRRFEVIGHRRPLVFVLALVCAGLVGLDAGILVKNSHDDGGGPPRGAPPATVDRAFRQTRGNRWLAYYYFKMSRGVLACFDDYNVSQSTELRGDLPAEEYLRDKGAGTVIRKAWAPGRIDLEVSLLRPARVYVNQNWHPGWHASDGAFVSEDGLLAVDLPAGKHAVVLRFLPRSAIAGGLTSIAALGLALYVWARTRRRDSFGDGAGLGRDVALFASPLLVAAIGWAAMREPRRPPPALVTPDNEPIVATWPPDNATPVGARWVGEGFRLDAFRVRTTSTGSDIHATLELDWWFERRPPPRLGITVRIDGAPQGPISVSYAAFAGALLIEDVPLKRTIRDVSEDILLMKSYKPYPITVTVVVSALRGNGEALEDAELGGTRQDGGRVVLPAVTVP
jgi:hypothetical protein